MSVTGIDHVNILSDDIEATARFYEELLGYTREETPAVRAGLRGYWLRDALGNATVHLVDRLSSPERYAGYHPGDATNAVHHIAFACTDFDATMRRIAAMGIEHRVNDMPDLGIRQVFCVDPNAINVELNFR